MDEASTLEGTRAQCDRIGELEVIQNLAKDGIWGNDLNRARPFAQAWLREQEWKRQKGKLMHGGRCKRHGSRPSPRS